MSIVTRTGDQGSTCLMYQRRVSKTNPRIEACGAVDELNAALGLSRAAAKQKSLRHGLRAIQAELVALMGELATLPQDWPRYLKEGRPVLEKPAVARLDQEAQRLEARQPALHGWATPGTNLASAALDMARTICRRAERRVCALHYTGQLQNPQAIVYLNRLSDLLWLWARAEEGRMPRRVRRPPVHGHNAEGRKAAKPNTSAGRHSK
jgi:cob(I)alamin adenosyltransferase